ncbi:MAG: helix-turn-helix domain-containing protein [Clostridia bacterium]|nr:helix-turn-helix domain-containing protein [Clostridia bacterium]
MEIFAEKLKRLRNSKELSQSQLAEKIYVSRSAVAKWEQGRGFPSIDSLQLISAEFCVTIDELVSDKEVEILKIQKDKKLTLRTKLLIALSVVFSVIFAVIIATGATLAVMYYPRKLSKYLTIEAAEVDAVYLEYYRDKNEDGYGVEQVKVYLDEEKINLFIDYLKKIEVIPRYQPIKSAPRYEFVIVCGNTSYYFSHLGLRVYENDEYIRRDMFSLKSGSDSYLLVLFDFDKDELNWI